MATDKQGFVRATEHQHSVSVQQEKDFKVQAPLPAMYIQAVSDLSSYPQAQPAAMQDAAVIPLSMPMMYTNQTLPFLTLHIASGAGLQQQRPEPPVSSPRPKSAGKHVCPHCGRDCLKPSVLEKHLRCHTGERPYPCATCGISFKTQSNLYKHKRTQAHARLSNESGKGTLSSQDSSESSRENCQSPSLELQNEDSDDTNKNDGVLPTLATNTDSLKDVKTGSETEWALCKAAVVGVIASPAHGQQVISHTMNQRVLQLSSRAAPVQAKSANGEGRTPLTPNRIPLQRQEALLPKSQSHDSTDSGFSETNEQHSTTSPETIVHNPSMELEEPESSDKLTDAGPDDIKSKVSLQEKQKLEKHILKLISENSVVMDDKHLVNVRPRKTVLSKQGSIDLPTRYTYKDSFHFEIRSSKHQLSTSQKQDRKGRAFYSSMPTQHSTSLEHAPLTRSSSLPFSVGIQNSEGTVSPYRVDNVPLSRRCSAGHTHPFNSIDQHTPSHRSLVRQVAVDGLSGVEGSPMERDSFSSLSSDGDPDTAFKRCRRKKAQKFAYNKWYMYGGGTFKKLYNTEKDSVLKSRKATLSSEQSESQGIQVSQHKDCNTSIYVSCTSSSALSLPPVANVLTEQTSSQVLPSYLLVQNTPMKQPLQSPTTQTNVPSSDLSTVINATNCKEEKGRTPEIQLSNPIPSERKKQKTDEHLLALAENTMGLQRDNGLSLNRQGSFTNMSSSNHKQLLIKRHSSPHFVANMSGTSASPSASSRTSSVSQAKTSFLPKYQLKIPASTDGTSDSGLGKGTLLNSSSPRQNVSLNQQPAATSTTPPQNQSNMTAMAPGQEQVTLTITAITKATSTTPAAASTSTYTSVKSVSSASPLAFTDPSVTVCTTHSSHSRSHSCTLTQNSQVYAGNLASVQTQPATSVVVPIQSPVPVLMNSTHGVPLEISSTEIQGSKDTFYVQTADLHIVMQLISDEQLALIEPQIETQDYKTPGGHAFRSKDKETSRTDIIQTAVSKETHKQCSGDTRTRLAAEQGNVNRSVLSSIPDISLMSVTEHKVKSAKCVQDVCLKNTCPKQVISRSPFKSEHDVALALPDSMALGHQCKLLTTQERTVPKDSETVGCGIIARSGRSEKLSKPSTAKNESEARKDQIIRNHGASQSTAASTNNAAKLSEAKLVKVATSPETSEQPVQTPGQQHKSLLLTKSVENHMAETSPCIYVTSSVPGLPPAPISASNQDELIQTKADQPSTATTRALSSCCPQPPLNQTSAVRSKYEGNPTSASSQSGQHIAQQACVKTEDVKSITSRTAHVTTAQSETHGPVSNRLKEDNIKCELDPGGTLYVKQESFTGPPVSCSLQSLKFQREAGTGRQKWIPPEPKSGGGDGAECVETWDTECTWIKQEEDPTENKREEEKCPENYHIPVKPHLEGSTSQHMINVNAASPELACISNPTAVCGMNNPSPESKCLTNKDHIRKNISPGPNVVPKQIAHHNPSVKEYVSLGHHEMFTALSKGPGDVKHLLAHPILVNAFQTEVQTETQTKNSAYQLTHSTSSQAQMPLPDRETDGTTRFGLLSEPFVTFSCNTEHCQIIKTTPEYTHPSGSTQTNSSCIHPTYTTSSIHSNPTDANPPHNYMEEEERSSSSDDEGKLVIELE